MPIKKSIHKTPSYSFEKPDSAFYFFEECRKLSVEKNFQFIIPIAYKNVGKCYLLFNKEKEGIAAILKSVDLFLKNRGKGTRVLAIFSCVELAKYYSKKQKFKQSNFYALKGLELNTKANFTDNQQALTQILYQNNKEDGNLKEAIKYQEMYQEVSDKINQDFLKQQHSALEERVKNELQKNKISLLNQEKKCERKRT